MAVVAFLLFLAWMVGFARALDFWTRSFKDIGYIQVSEVERAK